MNTIQASPTPDSISNRRRGWIVAAITVGGLAGAHLYAVSRPTLTGPLLILDHLFNIALAFALLAVCTVLGQRAGSEVCRWLDCRPLDYDSAVEEFAFSTVIGTGILGTAILLLGALGGINGPLLLLLLVTGCVAARQELAELPALGAAAARELVDKAKIPALAVFAAIALAMIVLAAAPPTDWDSLMYHLQIPSQFLDRGEVYLPIDNLHVSYVGLFHMLYIPLLAIGAPAACALLSVMMGLALGCVMLTAGTRMFSPIAGRLAMVLLWGSPILFLGAVTPRVDVVLTCYLFLGHYALLRAWRSTTQSREWIVLSGVTLGLACAVKYLAVAYVVALIPLVLIVALRMDSLPLRRLGVVAVFAVVGLLGALPWLLKNWIMLGGPFYPRFTQQILPPWLVPLYDALPDPPAVTGPQAHPLGAIRESFSLYAWFVSPELLTPESEGTAYSANRLFPVLLLSFAMWRNRTLLGVLLPALVFVAAVLLYSTSLNLRYLTPTLPALTLAVAALISAFAGKTSSRSLRAVLLVLLTGIALVNPVSAINRRLTTTQAPAHAFGLLSRSDYLQNPRNSESASYLQMISRVNQLTEPDDLILLLFEARGYRFDTPTVQDNVLLNWTLLSPAIQPPRCLETSGITHVLVATGVLGYFQLRGLDPASIGWEQFGPFASRCLVTVESGRGWTLLEVRAAS